MDAASEIGIAPLAARPADLQMRHIFLVSPVSSKLAEDVLGSNFAFSVRPHRRGRRDLGGLFTASTMHGLVAWLSGPRRFRPPSLSSIKTQTPDRGPLFFFNDPSGEDLFCGALACAVQHQMLLGQCSRLFVDTGYVSYDPYLIGLAFRDVRKSQAAACLT